MTAILGLLSTRQFGHNDQKPENGISLDEYQANLEGLVTDVQDRSGIPVRFIALLIS